MNPQSQTGKYKINIRDLIWKKKNNETRINDLISRKKKKKKKNQKEKKKYN